MRLFVGNLLYGTTEDELASCARPTQNSSTNVRNPAGSVEAGSGQSRIIAMASKTDDLVIPKVGTIKGPHSQTPTSDVSTHDYSRMVKLGPLVCCVCLTADRQELTERAVRCFERQTYARKQMLILDTGAVPVEIGEGEHHNVYVVRGAVREGHRSTIGALRNTANAIAKDCDIIAHFDSDDYSLPNRLTDQVRFLLETEAAPNDQHFRGVAYRKLLFWNRHQTTTLVDGGEREVIAEAGAWSYNCTFPFPGATFLYRRELWERFPFPDRQTGEDTWWEGRNFLRASPEMAPIVCEIHSENTSSHVRADLAEWKREAALDDSTRKILEKA